MCNTIKPRFFGALLECMKVFPLFEDDYQCLEANGFLRQLSPERCEWLKSKTSLAEYFKWVGLEAGRITGGFWNPISRAFCIDKKQLQKLAGGNGNLCKPPKSRDFIALKALVIPLRPESYRIRREMAIFHAIARLVNDAQCDNAASIRNTLQEVEKIVLHNVEENDGN